VLLGPISFHPAGDVHLMFTSDGKMAFTEIAAR